LRDLPSVPTRRSSDLVYGEEQIRLCAEIELQPTADPESVLLAIYKNLEEHLSPTLPFYTLQEMLQKKKSVEAIFEGRPLSADSQDRKSTRLNSSHVKI